MKNYHFKDVHSPDMKIIFRESSYFTLHAEFKKVCLSPTIITLIHIAEMLTHHIKLLVCSLK